MKLKEVSHREKRQFPRFLIELGISYREVEHEALLDYHQALEIRSRFGLIGRETKILFMKGGDGERFLVVNFPERRLDLKQLREICGTKLTFASQEELKEETGAVPGCVSPFGLPREVSLIIDKKIFDEPYLVFSTGTPYTTVELSSASFKTFLRKMGNPIILW